MNETMSIDREGWEVYSCDIGEYESFEKLRKALEQDAKEAAERGSGLPKDWRSRILK